MSSEQWPSELGAVTCEQYTGAFLRAIVKTQFL
jgi:hypothetical protein